RSYRHRLVDRRVGGYRGDGALQQSARRVGRRHPNEPKRRGARMAFVLARAPRRRACASDPLSRSPVTIARNVRTAFNYPEFHVELLELIAEAKRCPPPKLKRSALFQKRVVEAQFSAAYEAERLRLKERAKYARLYAKTPETAAHRRVYDG